VVIATGRRSAYTIPCSKASACEPDTPLITSNVQVIKTLGGVLIDRCYLESRWRAVSADF